MDIKQLLTMITLSQTLNYQKAAEQLQYAPSTLFKHIQMLEQEVGALADILAEGIAAIRDKG